MTPLSAVLWPVVLGFAATGCSGDDGGGTSRCGPTSGTVVNVVDGDTVDLDTGERIRYLMIDTPELSGGGDCYSAEARDFNSDLVLNKEVTLSYDEECEDRFNRLLAYVSVQDREVNSLLVERGFACVLYIPPNGSDRRTEFETLEMTAQNESRGMGGACIEVACD